MSVLIKGMKMPKCCNNCEFYWKKDVLFEPMHLCQIKPGYIDNADIHSIPHDCPLVELPEKHGDLIDIDSKIEVQFFDEQKDEWSLKTVTVGDYLCYASEIPSVVVEAEGDEE